MNKPSRRNGKTWLVAGLVLCAGAPSMSQEQPAAPVAQPDAVAPPEVPAPSERSPLSPHDVPPPPGIPQSLTTPVEGEVAVRSQMSPEDILRDVQLPGPVANRNPLAQPPLAEPIKALLARAGQEAAEGRFFDAITTLNEAQRLAPTHPLVLRELGLAYFASGNAVRGRAFLERVVSHDPTDQDALVMLARYAMQRDDWGGTLSWAKALQDAAGAHGEDAAALADYFRAEVFMQQGYTAAAIEYYTRVLAHNAQAEGSTAVDREWSVLHHQRSEIYLRLGDLHLSRSEVTLADAAYERVDPAGLGPGLGVVARRVYVDLLLHRQAEAIGHTAERLSRPDANPSDAILVDYLLEQGVPAEPIAQQLQLRYEVQTQSIPLLAGLSRVMAQAPVVELVEAYIADNLVSASDFGVLIKLLGGSASRGSDPAALARVIRLTAGTIKNQPLNAEALAEILLMQDLDSVGLIRALKQPEVAQSGDVWLCYLAGQAYEKVARFDDAVAAYARALDADEANQTVRIAQAQLLLHRAITQGRGTVNDAERVLGPVGPNAEWPRFELWIKILTQSSRTGSALRAIEQRGQLVGMDANLRILRAQIGVTAVNLNLSAALSDLRNLIAEQPTNEAAYVAAIQLIDQHYASFRDPNVNLFEQRQKLVVDLIRNVPESRLALFEQAMVLVADEKDPRPAEQVLTLLLDLYPNDQSALALLYRLYDESGRKEQAADILLRFTMTAQPGMVRRIELARFYNDQGQPQKTIELIERTLDEEEQGVLPGPPLTGDYAALLLNQLALAGVEDQAEPLYLRMVRRFPDNARLNNGLGYRWAMEGRNLRQAKAMIQRAMDAEGDSSSYFDSMAWVCYKMGQFAEAEAFQSQALELLRAEQLRLGEQLRGSKAVLYDHMGDILYRTGDVPSAIRHWQIARAQRVTAEEIASDPELSTLADRVNAKINATREGQEPPVADVPGEAAFGPEGHPADQPLDI